MNLPFTPSIAPLTTCWAATSYTWRVVVVGPKTLSEVIRHKQAFNHNQRSLIYLRHAYQMTTNTGHRHSVA